MKANATTVVHLENPKGYPWCEGNRGRGDHEKFVVSSEAEDVTCDACAALVQKLDSAVQASVSVSAIDWFREGDAR